MFLAGEGTAKMALRQKFSKGDTLVGNVLARADSWKKTIKFFETSYVKQGMRLNVGMGAILSQFRFIAWPHSSKVYSMVWKATNKLLKS